MRKRLILRLITLLLISLLFSASIVIVSVLACRKPPKPKNWKCWEEKETIIESLRELSSEISDLPNEAFDNPCRARWQRKVLRIKVCVVIWQVKVGAYVGAINKLKNDIKEKIERWIVDPWKSILIEKVEHIIELLEDLLLCRDRHPPIILSVLRFPETPNYDDYVSVVAQVIDKKSGVKSVILSYSADSASWVNVTMSRDDGLYVAEIPPLPYNTTVSYKIYAYDWACNLAISETDYYAVIDSYPPVISYIDRVPPSPSYDETVTVFANVTEPPEASGVKNVTLLYRTDSEWQPEEMALIDNLYTGIIPTFPYGTEVQYKIRAFDHAGNPVTSGVYFYDVTDSHLPLARIDEPAEGSFLAGMVSVVVFVDDENFVRAKLRIDSTIVSQWNSVGLHVFDWNTTAPEYPDGVYTLNLTAYDTAGNVGEDTITVTVDNTPPNVDVLEWEPEEPFADEEVEVSVWASECVCASGVKNVTLWYRTNGEWEFIEMVSTNGIWTATIPGQNADVNVKFYAEAYDNLGNGAKTSIYNYTVKAPPNLSPVATFTESAETVLTGVEITFDASESYDPDGSIVSYVWDFGDGTGGEGVVVSHAYEDDGVYTVTLTVTDDDGAIDSETSTKHVDNRPPVASFTESADTVYIDEVITFNASGSSDPDGYIVSYFWDFGDGTNATGVVTVDHAYAEEGNYTVTLTVTDDDGASSSVSFTKTVKKRPVGWPLALIAAIGLGIAALTATLLYALYRRRKKRSASSSGSSPVVTFYVPMKVLAGCN